MSRNGSLCFLGILEHDCHLTIVHGIFCESGALDPGLGIRDSEV